LHGLPTQYREVQGKESNAFLQLFDQFIVAEGGMESGFKHHQEKTWPTRLLHIKHKNRKLNITQVKPSHESMNSGDCFVLDKGLTIYQWQGSESSAIEKGKSMEFTRALADERENAKIIVIGISK
jgi:gelsolin